MSFPKKKILSLLFLPVFASYSFAQDVATLADFNTAMGNGSANINVTAPITVNAAVTANPATAYTVTGTGTNDLTGSGAFTIFSVTSGHNVTLSNLALAGTFTNTVRALVNGGMTTMNNVSLINATANGVNGNLIVNQAAATGLTINNSTFSGNNTTGNTTSGGGGVIRNAGLLNITGSSFINNNEGASGATNLNGGAIYNQTGATAHITDTQFIGNTTNNEDNGGTGGSGSTGGAIDNEGTMDITASGAAISFDSNIAGAQGGAIRNGGTLTITADTANINFTNNSAGTTGGAIQNAAGATVNLAANSGNITFSGNTDHKDTTPVSNALNVGGTANMKLNGTGNITFNDDITGANAANNALPGTVGAEILTVSGSGTGQLIINADASDYKGHFYSSGGTTVISPTGLMFGSGLADKGLSSNIVSGTGVLKVTSANVYYGLTMGGAVTTPDGAVSGGGTLYQYLTTAGPFNVGSTDTSTLLFGGSGSTMNFDKDPSVASISYNLAGPLDNGSANTVNLNNGPVTFAIDTYTGGTTYGFINDTLSISNPAASAANPVLRTVTLPGVTSSNSTLSLNLSITDTTPGGNSVINSDKLVAATGSGQFKLGTVGVLLKQDDGLNKTYDAASILSGGVTFAPATPWTVTTSIYQYSAAIDPASTGILLTVQAPTDPNSLNAANTYLGNSGFNMTYFTNQSMTYSIGSSLSNAAVGNLLVQGVSSSQSILDGSGANSFFKLTDATNLTANALTVQNAAGVDGSVLNISNAAATAALNDMIITANTASGNGGAVNATAGTVDMTNVNFDNNTATGQGGAIYMSGSTVNINQTAGAGEFKGNTAGGVSNAVNMAGSSTLNFNIGAGSDFYVSDNITDSGTGNTINLSGAGTLHVTSAAAPVTVNATSFNTAAGSNLELSVFSSGANDKIISSGADILNGALNVKVGVGTYNQQVFHLITADGGVSGNLVNDIQSGTLSLATLSAPADFTYTYDATTNEILLTISGGVSSRLHTLIDMSFNQTQIAENLDTLSALTTPGAFQDMINNTIYQTPAEQLSRLNQLNLYFLANIKMNSIINNYRPDLYAKIRNHCEGTSCEGSNNGVWAQLTGQWTRLDTDSNSPYVFHSDTYGAMAGADRWFATKDILAGIYGKYTKTDASQGPCDGTVDSLSLGGYGGLVKEKYDIKASLSVGLNQYDTARKILFLGETAKADFSGIMADADVEGALKFPLKDEERLTLRPYIGILVAMLNYGSYSETGGGPGAVDVSGGTYLRTLPRIGVELNGKYKRLRWYAGLQGQALLTGKYLEMEADFQQGPGLKFKNRSVTQDIIFYGAGLGGDFDLGKNWSAYIDGAYDMNSGFDDLKGNIGIRYSFCGRKTKETFAPAAAAKTNDNAAAPKTSAAADNTYDNGANKTSSDMAAALSEKSAPAAPATPATVTETSKTAPATSASADETYNNGATETSPDMAAALSKKSAPAAAPAKTKTAAAKPETYAAADTGEHPPMLFDFDSSALKPKTIERLEQIASKLQDGDYKSIIVEGHTDSIGTDEYNMALGMRRAVAAKNYLIKLGLDGSRIKTVSYGESRPAATNETSEGRALNRRVEVDIKVM